MIMSIYLEAGIGREIITPKVGGNLMGYRPDVISTSVHDDLTVSVAAFRYGDEQVLLLSVTVCIISNELADEIRTQLGKSCGLSPSRVILAATHTHSGPITISMSGWGDCDREYCDIILIPACIRASKKAQDSLQPVRMGIGETQSTVGVNRRELLRDGKVILGQNPWGVYDPRMTVLAFADTKGKPFFNIVHYGAHCTAAGMNVEITRDWAGVMIDRLEAESGAVTFFCNGAQGDVGPRLSNGKTTGDICHVIEIGAEAALDAVGAWRAIKDYREAELAVAEGTISIPCAPLPPLDTVRQMLSQYKEPPTVNLACAIYTTLKQIEALYAEGKTDTGDFAFFQTLFRIGPAVFIPFPFEIFSEITIRLRTYSKFRHTLSLSNTNGSYSYFPSQDQICRGGYEVEVFHWNRANRLPDDADTRIINENLKIMEKF
jgi:hypothetical protein